jgi:S-adenosylmethionine:tRNA ribosyltransferase-isomerase
VLVSDFDYFLPQELIAQQPLPDRAAARMLHLRREVPLPESTADRMFRDLPGLLRPDDLLVLNNSRVFPARLFGRRAGIHAQPVSGRNPAAGKFLTGMVEVLLTRQLSSDVWQCLVHPGRKIKVGERLCFGQDLEAEVIARGTFGERSLRFNPVPDFFAAVERIGHVPLPPYIDRADDPIDRDRYQTVYARELGSAAAPTAGLHFTTEVLERVRERGIEIADITLHVGLGTFQPVRQQCVEQNHLHPENYSISPETAERINAATGAGRRIVAVGTTTVRTLEDSAADSANGTVAAGSRQTRLFIYPGYKFQLVGALLTNFHLPRSTLLMLVCALAGRARVLRAYEHAVREGYRFYSYGDCMFIE